MEIPRYLPPKFLIQQVQNEGLESAFLISIPSPGDANDPVHIPREEIFEVKMYSEKYVLFLTMLVYLTVKTVLKQGRRNYLFRMIEHPNIVHNTLQT